MSAQHTPGPWVRMGAEPWTVDNDDSYGHSYTGIGAKREHPIALVVAADYQSNSSFDANARLIAAAPELLGVLQEANAAINSAMAQVDAEWRNHDKAGDKHDKIVREFRAKVCAAIAKATGQ